MSQICAQQKGTADTGKYGLLISQPRSQRPIIDANFDLIILLLTHHICHIRKKNNNKKTQIQLMSLFHQISNFCF